ncbi:MAG: GTPase [Culicoidibacterales bacterium]
MDYRVEKFDYDQALEEVKQSIQKPNILVAGATGVGKSSLINHLFDFDLAKIGSGEPETRGVNRHEKADKPVVFFDSEGYELGAEKISHFETVVLNFIDEKQELSNQEEHIHLVWYCISAGNKRVTNLDIEMLQKIQNKKLPVAILVTQIDKVDEEELEQITNVLKNSVPTIEYFTMSIDPEVPEEYIQEEEFMNWSLEHLDDALSAGFVSAISNAIKEKNKYVLKSIIPKYAAGAAAIGATPIPFSDAMALVPLQVTMTLHIMKTWGIVTPRNTVISLVQNTLISQFGKLLAASAIKLIPGIGTVTGAAINSTVAGTLTTGMGLATAKLCHIYAIRTKNGEHLDFEEIFSAQNLLDNVELFSKDK